MASPASVASVATLAHVGFGMANPVTVQTEFNTCGIAATPGLRETEGNRGTRDHISENVVADLIHVGGPYEVEPSFTILQTFLPWTLGGALATGAVPVADVLPSFFATLDRVVKVDTYAGCKVNKCTFSSSQTENLKMALDIQGLTETVAAAGTFPVLPIIKEAPFVQYGGTFTFNGLARNVSKVTVEIDNHLDLERFNATQTRLSLPELDRETKVTIEAPFTADEIDLYSQPVQPGVGGSLVWLSGDLVHHTFTLTFGALQQIFPRPSMQGKTEIKSQITFKAGSLALVPSIAATIL